MKGGAIVKQLSIPVTLGERMQGAKDAGLTLVEYGDYECPRCRQLHPILQHLQIHFDDGLCSVFRHFPLSAIHPLADYYAEVAEAAGTQNRFWEMHDYLLKQQLSSNRALMQFATSLGIDSDRFEREIAEHIYVERIQADVQSGIASGVNGTPTLFINGERYDGLYNFESLQRALKTV